jgi:hypothetical protein
MDLLIALLFAVVGVIHLLPLPGAFGARALERLYGIPLPDPSLVLLMRHRAVLFGMVGAVCLAATVRQEWRMPALVAGFVSVVSFLLLAWRTPGCNASVRRVVVADVVALVALIGAALAMRLAS